MSHVAYLDPEHITEEALWLAVDMDRRFLLWRRVPDIAKSMNIRTHGHFEGRPGDEDAFAARKALLILMARNWDEKIDGIFLVRDSDGRINRRVGLEQARAESTLRDRIAIGLAHTKRECWILAGFDPQNAREEAVLTDLRKELGFDPRLKAHELTASREQSKRNAKSVLRKLTAGDAEREERCLIETSPTKLEDRGAESGLSAFISEIRDRIVIRIYGELRST